MEFMVWVTSVRQYLHFSTTYCRYYRLANDGKKLFNYHCYFRNFNVHFGDKNEPKVKVPLASQFKKLSSNYKLYYLSLWYFITFGAFVAFGLFLPNYLVNNFGIDKVDAGIRSGVFIALATFLRPIGGILGDKFNLVKVLMIDFIIMIVGVILGISSHIALFTIGCLTISICLWFR